MVYAQPEATISALLSANFNYANITSGHLSSDNTLFMVGRVKLPSQNYPQTSKYGAQEQLILDKLTQYFCVVETRKIAEMITPNRIGSNPPSQHQEKYCVTAWVKAADVDINSIALATQDRQQIELEIKRVIRNNQVGNADIDSVYPAETYPLEDSQPDIVALGSAIMLNVWRWEST